MSAMTDSRAIPDLPAMESESDGRYRDLLERIPAATFVIQRGTIVVASRSAIDLMRAPGAEHVLGRAVMDFISPEDQARAAHRFDRTYAGQADGSLREYLVRRFDGSSALVAARSMSITYGGGPASLTVCIDISERHAAEIALRKSEARYRDLMEHLPLATWVFNNGTVAFANTAALRLAGAVSSTEVLGRPFIDFVRGGERLPMAERLARVTAGERPKAPMECGMLRLDGSEAEIEAHTLPIAFADQSAVLAVTVDVTEKKRAGAEIARADALLRRRFDEVQELQQQMREQAIRDALTDLYNRRYFDETVTRELARARRDKSDLAVLMLDIDHFKSVNDTYGHQAGDEVLRRLAVLLAKMTRAGDIPCRYGGEEFVVVMPAAPLAAAFKRAEDLRTAFAGLEIDLGAGRKWRGTLSAGVAVYPADAADVQGLIERADAALYAAKREGRNRTKRAVDLG